MKPVHILHCTLFLKMGGLESIIMDMARYIDSARFKISILCLSSFDEQYKDEMDKRGVKIFRIKRGGRFDFGFFKKIINLIETNEINILHAHSGWFFNAALCARLSSLGRLVYTEHGLPIYDNGLPMNTALKTRLEDRFAAWTASRIFAVSEEIRKDMSKRFPRSMKKVHTVTNGVDTDLFKPATNHDLKGAVQRRFAIKGDPQIIGSVGRLVPIKNYASLIKAFANLIEERGERYHLILVGDGVEKSRLEACARENKVQRLITFAGVQYGIQNILPAFDVFVLPSWTEGTSISLLEAQACGIPAVVTNVGGNPSIIEDGINGCLFEPDDHIALKAYLAQTLDDEHLRRRMSLSARQKVETRFSVRKMVGEYELAYMQLMNVCRS